MRRRYDIHPGIGIARVGDSPDDYFVGPEAPGFPPLLAKPDSSSASDGHFRDAQKRIKRQGARFRVYETTFDDSGNRDVREITAADARIEWTVHLRNAKAAALRFTARPEDKPERRNLNIPEDQLVIDSGEQHIAGERQGFRRLAGFFQGIEVQLGDLLTDSAGRLIVLGGFGRSLPGPRNLPVRHFANNDDWCDDVSDGPVRATIQLNGGTEVIAAQPAWIIVAPPDFAPAVENVITLYDLVYNVMAKSIDHSLDVTRETIVSFTKDIYPILRRVSTMHWVSNVADAGHGPQQPMHFLSRLPELASNTAKFALLRNTIFKKLRKPSGGGGNMPKLPASISDAGGIDTSVALTECQFERMRRWAEGTFEADWPGTESLPPPTALDDLPVHERPAALDRAALEACVGGAFFPGIEVGRVMLDQSTYDQNNAFRIDPQRDAGTLTARMAVPWQADFFECALQPDAEDPENGMDWWPGQRPVNVLRRDGSRGNWSSGITTKTGMVSQWRGLGFVVKDEATDRFVETERTLNSQ